MNYEEIFKDWFENENVLALCRYFFDITLTPNQQEIVKTIAFSKHPRVTITCMTRYGKSLSVSMGILLWILQNPNKRVVIIAPTNEKTTIIRNYIANFISKSPIFYKLLDIEKTGIQKIRKEVSRKRMTWKNGTEMRTLSAEGQGEALMGFGADLVIVDETCDIDYEIYRSKISRMLGDNPDSIYIEIGNPHNRDNHFFSHFIDPEYFKIHIGYEIALQEGRISQEFLDEQRNQLTSREFEILYKSTFPETSEDALINWNWIDKSQKHKEEFEGKVIAGLDVAEHGQDSTVISICIKDQTLNKYRMIYAESWDKIDLMPTVGRVLPIIEKYKIEKITVDATGVGSGVYSRLDELRREGKIKCEVSAFKGGMQPSSEQAKERFMNIKAEAYWHLRKLFEDNKVYILPYKLLLDQLTKMKWELTSSEKIRIRDPGTKEGDTSEEKSPDWSDSLCYCVFGGSISKLVFAHIDIKTPMEKRK